MQEVTFNLQTITPLFLAGADQAAAELRAPSFRGVMRYWLRALVSGVSGDQPRRAENGQRGRDRRIYLYRWVTMRVL